VAYKDQVEFVIVYVREAHPEMLKEDHATGVVGRPKDIDERVILATECVTEFEFTIPMVIDGMDGKVNEDYKAAPVRVAITDRDGKIVYYAGRGPRDFRLPAVEHVLKRLVANKGYVPAPPEPRWGEPVNGLRCGISFDPPSPRIGEDVVVHFQFNNVTDNSLGLLLSAENVGKNLALTGDGDRRLLIKSAGSDPSQSRRGNRRRNNRSQVHEIKAHDSLFCDIYGTLQAGSESSTAGKYHYQFSMEVDASTVAELEEEKENGYDFPLWAGQVNSGETTLEVSERLAERCIDCHGKKDYHHLKSTGCEDCHTGQVGEEDFDTRSETCGQCHPRATKQGRRQILGKDGEFNQVSRHVYGGIEDSDCLTCHDPQAHQNGTVSLINPSEDESQPWYGTPQDFCLTCHTRQPPESASFPANPKGSGYDKSLFVYTTHAKWLGDASCAHCHVSHGSADHALLRGPYVVDPNQTTASTDADYGLCWTCHDPDLILKKSNAFDQLHRTHVAGRGMGCAACHDVHGSSDQGEAGLIKFRTGAQSNWLFRFEIDVDRNQGSCYVSCHKDNKPRSYTRDHKRHTVTCLHCH